jgi:hypothetical protein
MKHIFLLIVDDSSSGNFLVVKVSEFGINFVVSFVSRKETPSTKEDRFCRLYECKAPSHLCSTDGHSEEETQRRNRAVDGRGTHRCHPLLSYPATI